MKTAADYAADIAKALEAGPTDGPWIALEHSWSDTSIVAPSFDHGICRLDINHATEESQPADEAQMAANANFISACDPVAIRSILESLDQSAIAVQMLTGEVERLRKDADRYRWLREGGSYIVRCPKATFHCGGHVEQAGAGRAYPAAFDDAIDAALKDTK